MLAMCGKSELFASERFRSEQDFLIFCVLTFLTDKER